MRIPERCANNFFQGMKIERNSGHMKCRYRIIGRLISIKVLWEFLHPNTPIKRWTLDWARNHLSGLIHHHPSLYIIFPHHLQIGQFFADLLSGGLVSLPSLFHRASYSGYPDGVPLSSSQEYTPANLMTYWRVDTLSLLRHLTITG